MPLPPASIGIVLTHDDSKLLLVKRVDVPIWVLPGGGIEPGETPENALLREIKEETGLDVKIVRQCAEYSPANALTSKTYVFVCHIHKGETCLSDETQDVAFHPMTQLPSLFFPPHAAWLDEAMASREIIRRSLTEISYLSLAKYFFFHPWYMIRYAWTRFLT